MVGLHGTFFFNTNQVVKCRLKTVLIVVQSGDKRALSKYNTEQKSATSLKIYNNKTKQYKNSIFHN